MGGPTALSKGFDLQGHLGGDPVDIEIALVGNLLLFTNPTSPEKFMLSHRLHKSKLQGPYYNPVPASKFASRFF